MAIRRRIKSWVHAQSAGVRAVIALAALGGWFGVLGPFARGFVTGLTGGAYAVVGIVTIVGWLFLLYVLWAVATSFWSRTRIETDEQPAS